MTSRATGPRWVAHPPPGLGPEPRVRRLHWPYAGPPVAAPDHPTWGFPPVAVLHGVDLTGQPAGSAAQRGPVGLVVATALCLVTGVAALAAAAAEAARFVLLLRGRTLVLSAAQVRLSDIAVQACAAAVLLFGIAAAAAAVDAVVSIGAAAAGRAGIAQPRTPRAVVARLLVPGWNLYGAGQVLVEAFRLVHRSGSLGASDSGDVPRPVRRLLAAWWSTWLANGAILMGTLVFSFGSSDQAMADAVEWHIALDLSAALVAGLSAALLRSLRRAWFGRDPRRYRGWTVASPERQPEREAVRQAASDPRPSPEPSADLRGHAGKHRRR